MYIRTNQKKKKKSLTERFSERTHIAILKHKLSLFQNIIRMARDFQNCSKATYNMKKLRKLLDEWDRNMQKFAIFSG
jgi:hypothetical protein